MIITEKKFCIFSLIWVSWHWGLLLLGFVPPPLRQPLMIGALIVDLVCFVIWFYLAIFKYDEIRSNRWKRQT